MTLHTYGHVVNLSCFLHNSSSAANSMVESVKPFSPVVFTCHPLFLNDPEEEDDYFNIPRNIRQVYLALFQKYGIKTVLAGHLHQNNLTTNCQLEVVTTGSIGMPLGQDPSGFRIVKVYDGCIKHKYFGMDDAIGPDFWGIKSGE